MAENLNTLYYALGLDDHEMQDGLKKAIQNLSVLDDEFNRINKAIEETFGKKIKNAPIHNEIKGVTARLRELEKQWKGLNAEERRGQDGDYIRLKYKLAREEVGNLNKSLAQLYSESQKAASGQKGLAAQFGLVNKELTLQSRLMSNVKTLFTTYVSIFAVKSFIQNLARVRGEFENQQIALRAILRDAEAADKLFGQIKSFAVVSPFEFKDLVGYAKQLSAFQVPVNELFETTKRLADVSAGLGVGMDRIILAYGQVRSAAVLRGQELRQFTEAGIPLVDELAKKFSELEGRVVSAGDVFEKISNRMVSFEMVKEIFEDMTNEGGMFYMMQEKQAESLKGKIANLADAYDIMLNDIGQANDGILKGGVEGLSKLMTNWRGVADALKVVVATYGTYRAAVIALNISDQIAKYSSLTKAIQSTTAAQKLLNSTLLTNPWVLAATAIAAVGMAMYNTYQEANRLRDELESIANEQLNKIDSSVSKFEELSTALYNSVEGSQQYRDIISQINRQYGEYLPNLLNEANALTELKKNYDLVTDAIYNKAKAQAYEKGQAKIEEEFGEIQQEYTTQLIQNLTGSGISEKAAKNLVALYRAELEKQVGEYNPIEIFNNVYQSYFQTAEKYFTNIGVLAEQFREGTPFFRSESWGWESAYSSLVKYNDVFDKVKASAKEYSDYVDTMFSRTGYNTEDEAKKIEEISKKYEQLRDEAYKSTSSQDEYNEALDRLNIEKLKETLAYYKGIAETTPELARPDIIKQLENQLDLLTKTGEAWRDIVKDTIGKNKLGFVFNVQTDDDIFGYIDKLRNEYAKLKGQQKEINDGLVASDDAKNTIDSRIKILESLSKALNFSLEKDKRGGSTKDTNAERLKEQIDLIKKAQAQYEKYLQIMSPDEALNAIRADQQFMALDVLFEPDKVRERLQMVMNDIGKLPQSPELEKLKKSIQVAFTDIDYADAKKNFDQFLGDLTKELDTYKDKFNIYEQILNLGGSEELAINLSGVESGNLVNSIKTTILKAVQEVRPTVTIETVLDQKDLPNQVQKLVDAANKAVDDAQKNNLLSAAKLLTMDSPEGMGMSFDLGNIVKKYSVELLKLQNELRNALNAEGLTDEQKNEIQANAKLAMDANTKIYADKAKKSGAVYAQEQIEIDGLGEAFKNMSTASYDSLLKMLEITEKAKNDLISGVDAVSGFKNAGFSDQESQRLATEEPIFTNLFNSEDLEQFQIVLGDIDTILNSDEASVTSKLGIKPEDIEKLKLWVSQQKGAATAVANTQSEINKFRIDRIVKMLGDLSRNLDGAIDGIRNLAGAFGKELDEMTEGALNMLSTIVSSTTNVVSTITTTTQASATAMQSTSIAAATAIQTVEKASVILAVIGAALQIATAIAGVFSNDKKLDKEIKASQLRVEKLQNLYSEVERLISRNLGGAQNLDLGLGDTDKRLAEINNQISQLQAKSKNNIILRIKYSSNIKELEKEQKKLQSYSDGGAYAVQRENLIQQQEELRKQRQAEIDKKKTDQSKVADYENQIKELDDTIRHFAEDTLKELYNIDLKDWASQIGDSLFDAWKKGEDGAEAFRNKVGELMGQVMNEILKIKVLEPAMKGLQDKLFGTDGKGGYFGKDFELSDDEVVDIAKSLMSVQDSTDKYNKAMDKVEEELNKFGVSMKESTEEDEGLSKGIKGITEDTAQLLASYLNAIRGSVLLQELYMKNIDTNVAGIYQAMGGSPNITTTTTIPPEIIAAISEPFKLNNTLLASIDANMANVHSISANALAQLVMIQANTYNTAMATRDAVEELRGVISPGHPKGGNGIKVWA